MSLSPQPELLFLGTYDATLAQLFVVRYLPVGELSVFAEYDVEAHSEYAQPDNHY